MQCASCGAEVGPRASFCTTCGQAVNRVSGGTDDQPADVIPPPPPPPPPAATPAVAQRPADVVLPSPEATIDKPAPAPRFSSGRPLAWLGARQFRILSIAFLALALVGTGFLLGWGVGSDRSLIETKPDERIAEEPAGDQDATEISMPDVRGLATADARQVLADAGVSARTIHLQEQPAAGEPGIVIAQDPVYGEVVADEVVLTGSTIARVPSINGREATEVLDELEEFGAEVETVSEFVPGAVVGSVVEIEPAPGEVLDGSVRLVIAAEPGEVKLATVDSQDGYCYTDEDSMNGRDFAELLVCEAYDDAESDAWVIDRAATSLTAIIGVPDSGEPSESIHLDVVGDGTVLASYDVSYGATRRIEVDLTGVLRLTFRYRSNTRDYGYLGIGAATLLGDQRGLDDLAVD